MCCCAAQIADSVGCSLNSCCFNVVSTAATAKESSSRDLIPWMRNKNAGIKLPEQRHPWLDLSPSIVSLARSALHPVSTLATRRGSSKSSPISTRRRNLRSLILRLWHSLAKFGPLQMPSMTNPACPYLRCETRECTNDKIYSCNSSGFESWPSENSSHFVKMISSRSSAVQLATGLPKETGCGRSSSRGAVVRCSLSSSKMFCWFKEISTRRSSIES